MREAMRGLAQQIIGAYDARVKGVAQIRKATQVQLRELDRAHRSMARELRTDLEKVNPALDQAEAARRQDEARRAKDRTQAVAQRKSDVGVQLQQLDRAHNAMARQQRAYLSKGQARLRASVSTQLQELDEAHKAMAHGQRDDLAQGRADLTHADAHRRPEVRSWLGGLTGDRLAAGQEWRQMATALLERRAGVMAPEAPREVAPPPPTVRARRRRMETPPRKKAVAIAEADERTPKTLQERVFSFLANRPDGTRLIELEREFELGRFRAAQVIQSLVSDGNAEKRDLLYFAA